MMAQSTSASLHGRKSQADGAWRKGGTGGVRRHFCKRSTAFGRYYPVGSTFPGGT
jgi:hypothetical protein